MTNFTPQGATSKCILTQVLDRLFQVTVYDMIIWTLRLYTIAADIQLSLVIVMLVAHLHPFRCGSHDQIQSFIAAQLALKAHFG